MIAYRIWNKTTSVVTMPRWAPGSRSSGSYRMVSKRPSEAVTTQAVSRGPQNSGLWSTVWHSRAGLLIFGVILRNPETEKSAQEAATAASTLLGIEGEALDAILTDVAEGVPPVSDLFEIDLGTPEEIRGRLQTAKDVLLTTTPQDTTQSIQRS